MKKYVLMFLFTVSIAVYGEDVLQVVPIKTTSGVNYNNNKYLEFSLTNSVNVANLQFDIMIPEGVSLRTASQYIVFDERAQIWNDEIEDYENLFTVTTNKLTSGYTRFVFTPSGKGSIASGSGVIMKIPYKTDASMSNGIYPIVMYNIRLDKSVTETIVIDYASSYLVIGDTFSTSSTINMSGMTGYMPSFVVDELNTAIASNTNLKTLNLSGVTELGGELSVPEGAFWHTANAAKLNRTFTAGAKSTICLPFEISSSVASSLGKFYQFDGISDGKVVMRQTTGALSANTPYIYEPSSAQAGIGVTDATISFSENPVTENAEAQYTFKGTYEPITWASPVGIYGFAKAGVEGFDPGQFVRGGSGVSIAPYRAYLEYTGEGKLSAARTRGIDELPVSLGIIYIDSYGNTTIIDSAVSVTKKQTGNWYGVDGTGYGDMPTRKGIYINNGKKVVIK